MSNDKELFAELLNAIGTVEEQVQTRDARNEVVTTWQTKIASLPCRVQKKTVNDLFSSIGGSGSNIIGQGEYIKSNYTIYASVDNDIKKEDRIIVNNKIYEVIEPPTDSSLNHYEISCKLIE